MNMTRKEYAEWLARSADNGNLQVLHQSLQDKAKELRTEINACKDEAKRRNIILPKLTKTYP